MLGMFMAVDPQAHKYPGVFPYAYCINNPIKYIDPDGENPILIGAIIVGAYLGGAAANKNFNPLQWDYGAWQTYAGIAVGGAAGWAGTTVGAAAATSAIAGGSSSIGAGIVGGMVGGMVSGGINGAGMTAVMGGGFNDIMSGMTKGAVIGGLSGALSGGVGAAIGDFSGVAGGAFKNAMYEFGHSAIKGAATGLAGGAMMAAMTQDANYLWKGAAMGAALNVGMAGLRIGLMGSTIIPPGIEGRFDADDAAFGIKSGYPVYRRGGGLLSLFTEGITLGRHMMVNAQDVNSNWYRETLAHERYHVYQQKLMGSFKFYARTLYEYLISPGYSIDLYYTPGTLEYDAQQYMYSKP